MTGGNNVIKINGTLRFLVTAGLSIAYILIFNATAFTEELKALRGDPFSDPSFVQEMPPEWQQQPIQYDETVEKADLVVSLNQQFYHFLEPLIRQYAGENELNIIVNKGTCGITSGMLSKKKGDIGGFCCPPALTDRLPGIRFHTIGIHPVSILVHPDNPVENVSLDEVRQIFQGDIYRWSDVGGRNKAIFVIGRLHCKKRPGHWRLLLDNEDLFAPELRTVGAIEDMYSLVSSNPDAIGYEVMWQAQKQHDKVKALKINGRPPEDLGNLLAGKYPFYRALYLTTWEGKHVENSHAQLLIDYITREIEKIGKQIGIVPEDELRKAGWKFRGAELIGEPG